MAFTFLLLGKVGQVPAWKILTYTSSELYIEKEKRDTRKHRKKSILWRAKSKWQLELKQASNELIQLDMQAKIPWKMFRCKIAKLIDHFQIFCFLFFQKLFHFRAIFLGEWKSSRGLRLRKQKLYCMLSFNIFKESVETMKIGGWFLLSFYFFLLLRCVLL